MFLNLREALLGLEGPTTNDRLQDACNRGGMPAVSITGIGGFPILGGPVIYTLMGVPITPEIFRRNMIEALGQSSVLTYLNPKERTLEEFGERCLKEGHTWAFHAIPITLCFANCSAFVEASFGRDGSFMQGGSWVEAPIDGGPRIFTVTGSLKAWKRYVGFRNDPSFRKEMQHVLWQTFGVLQWLAPEVFPD